MLIDEYLKKHKMKMAHLANHVDCHAQTIRAYIKGIRWPGYEMAKRIEIFTEGEVTVDELMASRPPRPRCPCCGRYILQKNREEEDDDMDEKE